MNGLRVATTNPAHTFLDLALERILKGNLEYYSGSGFTHQGETLRAEFRDYIIGLVKKPRNQITPNLAARVEELKKDFETADRLEDGKKSKYITDCLLRVYEINSSDWLSAQLAVARASK